MTVGHTLQWHVACKYYILESSILTACSLLYLYTVNLLLNTLTTFHLYLNTFRHGFDEGDDSTLAKVVEEETDKVE